MLPEPWISRDVVEDDDPDCGRWVLEFGDGSRWVFCDMEDCTGEEIRTVDFIARAGSLMRYCREQRELYRAGGYSDRVEKAYYDGRVDQLDSIERWLKNEVRGSE